MKLSVITSASVNNIFVSKVQKFQKFNMRTVNELVKTSSFRNFLQMEQRNPN